MNINDKAETHARYMAVRHMTDQAAADAMGRQKHTVVAYRRQYPDTAPDVQAEPPAPPAPKPPRPGVIQLAIPMVEPSRSAEVNATRSTRVSIKAPPPWLGITFDKQVTV